MSAFLIVVSRLLLVCDDTALIDEACLKSPNKMVLFSKLIMIALTVFPRVECCQVEKVPSCTNKDCLSEGEPGWKGKGFLNVTLKDNSDTIELHWENDIWNPRDVKEIYVNNENFTGLQQPIVITRYYDIRSGASLCYPQTDFVKVKYVFYKGSSTTKYCYETKFDVPAPKTEDFFDIEAKVSYAKTKGGPNPNLYRVEWLNNQLIIDRFAMCLEPGGDRQGN